jgi:hypothetical protein
MNIEEKLFQVLPDSFHDGALMDAKYENGTLDLYCFRSAPDPDGTDNKNTTYIKIRFTGVRELEVYDFPRGIFVPYFSGAFSKEEVDDGISYIDYLDFIDGKVEFGESIRFFAEDVMVIEASAEELD